MTNQTTRAARRRRTTRAVAALLIAVLTLSLVSCGDDSDDDAGGSGTTPTGAEAPDKITIGYQAIPNGDLVVKHEKYLEDAFPDSEIEWKLFDSGGSVNEAIVAGSIDIGLAGSSPVSRGISQSIEYRVPWIHDVIGDAEALVVTDDIGSIADLAGKKIATPFASTSHYSLLAALEDAGVSEDDVDIIDAEPDDIFAAWSRGDIDGAYVWNPNLAKMVDDGGKLLVTSAELAKKGKTTYDLAVVTNDFADTYPDAVKTWAEAQDKAVTLIKDDPEAASAAIGAELNITPEEAAAQLEDLIFLDASEQVGDDYLGGGLATNLFAAAKFNKDQGEIDEVQPEQAYSDAVDASFAAGAG